MRSQILKALIALPCALTFASADISGASARDADAAYRIAFKKECAGTMMLTIEQVSSGSLYLGNKRARIGRSAHVRRHLMPHIVKHFGVSEPQELVGKRLAVRCTLEKENAHYRMADPSYTLDLIAIRALHSGDYTPPTKTAIYARLVQALASFSPEQMLSAFDDVDRVTLHNAIHEIYYGDSPRGMHAATLERIIADISQESRGRIIAITAHNAVLPRMSCGCGGAQALLLFDTATRMHRYVAINAFEGSPVWILDPPTEMIARDAPL